MSIFIPRYIQNWVKQDLYHKMVFVGGPRQSGKTTLAKVICKNAGCNIKERYLKRKQSITTWTGP